MTAKYTVFDEGGETLKEVDVDVWRITDSGPNEDMDGICVYWETDLGDNDDQIVISDETLEELGYVRAT